MFITVHDLADKDKCHQMFKEKVEEYVSHLSSPTTEIKNPHHDTIRSEPALAVYVFVHKSNIHVDVTTLSGFVICWAITKKQCLKK